MAGLGSLYIDLLAKTGKFETDIGRAARVAEKRAKEIDRSFSRLGSRITGALGGIAAGFSLGAIIEETSKAEKALAALNNAVKNNAGAAGFTSRELVDMSSELQKLTTYGDDTIQEMQALLLTFRQISGPEFKRAQVAVLDLATALGKDLNSSALLVGRALADPEKGMKQLARAGVVLTASQQSVIKKLAETGKTSEAQAALLTQLESRFGGAARAARETFGGAIDGLKNSLGDLLESKSGLRETTSAINQLTDVLSSSEAGSAADSVLSVVVTGITAVGKAAAVALKPLADFVNLFGDVGALIDNKLFGRQLSEAEFGRIFGVDPRGTGPTRRRRVDSAIDTPSAPSEDFTKLADKLKEQIALYGKVGKAAEISYQIQSGALDELSKSEQAQVLALAKHYDAVVKVEDAKKKAKEEQKKAQEEVKKMTESVEEQIATFGKGEAAVVAYRVAHGDLAKAFAQAGADDGLKQKVIDLTAKLEGMDAEAIASARSMSDLTQISGDLRLGLEAFESDFEKRFLTAAGSTENLKQKLIDLTLQLEIMTDAASGAAEAISEFAQQNSESLNQGLDTFETDFEKRFLKAKDTLTVFQEQAARNTQDIIADTLLSGFDQGVDGILRSFGEMIQKLIAQAVAADLAKRLFGDPSVSGDGWIGIAMKAAGAYFGGNRAIGGPVLAGTTYRINEREPEFFRPRVGGEIIPLSKMNMGGGTVLNQNFSVRTETGDRVARRTEQQIAAAASRGLAVASRRNN